MINDERVAAGALHESPGSADIKVTFLTQAKAQAELIELTRTCESMEWAVAWATPNLLVDEALLRGEKFAHLIIGTHLYQTHPEVLEQFSALETARVIPPTGDLFHPKVYLFTTGASVKAVVGSHNLTDAAMNRNVEASMLIDGSNGDQALCDLRDFISRAWKNARILDHEFLERYRSQHKARAQARESIITFEEVQLPHTEGTGRAPHEMSWADFVQQIGSRQEPPLPDWLAVLDGIQQIFARHRNFAGMSDDERRLVAGTAGRNQALVDGVDYQLFGSMGGSGTFRGLVLNAPGGLSRALDAIPFSGTVSQADYDRFVSDFRGAFLQANAERTGGLATATRLLAMKRPDVFVCVNAANKDDLCAHFGVHPPSTTLDNYWERIIHPMRQTMWWKATKPADQREAMIWRGRAALLDVIYYDRRVHGN